MRRVAILLLSFVMAFALFMPAPSLAQRSRFERENKVQAPAVPGQFLIKFTPGTSAAQRASIVRANGGRIIDRITALDIEVAEFPALAARGIDTRANAKLMAALKRNPNIRYIDPNLIFTTDFVPNDPGVSQQWAWDVIDAYQAWDVTQGSDTTVVAIVDTGIQRNHPDLDAKIVAGYDFVDNDSAADDGNGHGTHVGGTAAAETNNSTGGAGTCPNCKLMPVRVLDNNGSGTLADVADGITWAADNGAHVINLSLGASSGASTLENAVNYAWNKGVFLACAAGNSYTDDPSYPAYYDRCYAIAATDSSDSKPAFSNYGSWVEVAAPGVDIYSTWIGSGYNTISGTSMATPHVAGLAGLLASQGLSNQQIWDRICATADDISGTGSLWTCGRINANRAVTNDGGGGDPPPPSDDVLVNGGFENNGEGWTQASSGGYDLIDGTRPRSGSYSAWLGGYDYAYDRVYQLVTVPSGGTLTYWWYQTSDEGTGTAYDYFRVRLYDSNGNLITTLKTRSNRDARGAWYQDSIDVSGYAGQSVYIHFSVDTDGSLSTSFWVDDANLQ